MEFESPYLGWRNFVRDFAVIDEQQAVFRDHLRRSLQITVNQEQIASARDVLAQARDHAQVIWQNLGGQRGQANPGRTI